MKLQTTSKVTLGFCFSLPWFIHMNCFPLMQNKKIPFKFLFVEVILGVVNYEINSYFSYFVDHSSYHVDYIYSMWVPCPLSVWVPCGYVLCCYFVGSIWLPFEYHAGYVCVITVCMNHLNCQSFIFWLISWTQLELVWHDWRPCISNLKMCLYRNGYGFVSLIQNRNYYLIVLSH